MLRIQDIAHTKKFDKLSCLLRNVFLESLGQQAGLERDSRFPVIKTKPRYRLKKATKFKNSEKDYNILKQ